ncbi:beta strand repeat-containing protein, partial [Clostridium thailandense]|uniref:beta strand repeat-containing protein n=1 Tax=Clostridium thailandense TaxID=2794346 RepID=UPI00398A16DB
SAITLTTGLSTVPTLPSTVNVTLGDGTTKAATITWSDAAKAAATYATAGTVTVSGTLADYNNYPVSATVTVNAQLTVSSVTALNAKQVQVAFNQPVDKDTMTLDNFVVTQANDTAGKDRLAATGETIVTGATVNTGSVVLNADSTVATITLNDKAAFNINPTTVTVKVSKNVKDAAGNLLGSDVTKTCTYSDAAVPTLVSVTQTGSNVIEAKFSEPLWNSTIDAADAGAGYAPDFKIDNGAVAVATAVRKASDNCTFIITTGGTIPAGTHTLTVNKAGTTNPLEDYATYKLLEANQSFTAAADANVPTVTVKSAEESTVYLKFSKPVTIAASDNIEFRVGYNATGVNKLRGLTDAARITRVPNTTDEYKLVFASPIQAGPTSIYIHYNDATALDTTNSVYDGYGNQVAQDTTLSATVTQDTTAPIIQEVKYVDATNIDVTYSEAVTGANVVTNYTLKDPNGNAIAINSATQQGTTNTYRLNVATMAAGGNFTLAINSNVKDTSVSQNKLVPVIETIAATDKTAPTINTATGVTSNGAAGAAYTKLYATFSEPMKSSGSGSVLDPENYRLALDAAGTPTNVTKLPDGTSLTLNGNVVTIELPSATAIATFDHLIIGQVQDLAGNSTTDIQNYCAINNPATATIPTGLYKTDSAKMTDKKTLTFTYNRQLKSIDASKITETSGTTAAGASATFVNNADGTSTVTVTLDKNVTTGTAALVFQFAAGAFTDLNDLSNATEAGAIAATQVKDYIKPEVTSIATNDTDHNGKIDEIDVTFSENIYSGSVQDSDFTVEGYTIQSTSVAGNVVKLAVKEGANPDTAVTPKVTQVGTVQDASDQRNESSLKAETVATDGAAPVALKWSISTNTATAATLGEVTDAITITYSEPVTLGFTATDATKTEWDAEYTLKDNAPTTGALAAGTLMTASGSGTDTITYTVKTAALSTLVTVANSPTLDTIAGGKVEDAAGNDQAASAAIPVTP